MCVLYCTFPLLGIFNVIGSDFDIWLAQPNLKRQSIGSWRKKYVFLFWKPSRGMEWRWYWRLSQPLCLLMLCEDVRYNCWMFVRYHLYLARLLTDSWRYLLWNTVRETKNVTIVNMVISSSFITQIWNPIADSDSWLNSTFKSVPGCWNWWNIRRPMDQ